MDEPIDLHPQPRIDVHWLSFGEDAQWRDACMASLAGAPIRLHRMPGIAGRLGQARAAGFAQGGLPLVAWIDPDDLYEASAFAQLADALEACPQAVLAYTDEALIDAAGRPLGLRRLAYSAFLHAHSARHVHGLVVMRRSAVTPCLDRLRGLGIEAEWVLTRLLAQQGRILHLPIVGRHWRQHPGQYHRRQRIDAPPSDLGPLLPSPPPTHPPIDKED